MEYIVVKSHDFDDFLKQVNGLIEKGWELQGGVSHAIFSYTVDAISEDTLHKNVQALTHYAQALVKG